MAAGTRRTHNKTRLGCTNCKKRRIKCDCIHPVCDNCQKRGLECSFLLLAPSSRLSIITTTKPFASSTTPLSGSPSASTASAVSLTSPPSATIIEEELEDVEIISRSPPCFDIARPRSTVALADIELFTELSSISPYLRCNDVWKDARETLSPDLQGLLYHYEYTTSLTLAERDPAKAAWQLEVPKLASRHQFLVYHIIAVASLHLGRLHGHGAERLTMMNVAAAQMNKALARYRPALENINAENASALFASATLTAVYFFRTSTVEIDEIRASVPIGTIEPSPEVVNKLLHCVLRVIGGLRGPLAVLIPGFQYVMDGHMSPVLDRNWWPDRSHPHTQQATEEDTRLAQIADLWKDQTHVMGSSLDSLTSALFHLREAYALVSVLAQPDTDFPSHTSIDYSVDGTTPGNLKDRGAIFFWATRISRDFIGLLEQRNREALVIMAHYAVLPGRARNAWWLEGLGANMVMAVAMALGRENWGLIEWPVRVLRVDLENAFTFMARPDRLEGSVGEVAMEII